MIARRYPIVIEPTGTGYSAYSPDVQGCAAVGDSEGETRRNFQDALSAHFEVMREVGEPIPEPHGFRRLRGSRRVEGAFRRPEWGIQAKWISRRRFSRIETFASLAVPPLSN